MKISDKIIQQIEKVRSAGKCNMLDTLAIQQYANDNFFYELVIFIEENRREYAEYIMTRKRWDSDDW